MFQPTLPLSGFSGWNFLQRTLDRQTDLFQAAPANQRATDHFAASIADVQTADQLVNDRQLLQVALGAFGLGEDINNKAFIEKILTDGSADPDGLPSRLADKRYAAFAEAFGFDGAAPKTQNAGFADSIIADFTQRSFEIAVGEQQDDLRLALNVNRELGDIATADISDNAKWYSIMGNPPLRQVFETALNLPSSFSQLDLDQQLDVFKDKARARFGSDQISQFSEPKAVETLIQQFLLQSEVQSFNQTTSSASIALTLIGG